MTSCQRKSWLKVIDSLKFFENISFEMSESRSQSPKQRTQVATIQKSLSYIKSNSTIGPTQLQKSLESVFDKIGLG